MSMLALSLLLTLGFHAPATLADGSPAHDRMTWALLALKGQPACYRPACEVSVACWDSVRVADVPDTLASGLAMPGDSVTVVLSPALHGQFTAIVRNGAGWARAWSNVVAK